MCKKSSAECKKEHTDCLNGDVCKFFIFICFLYLLLLLFSVDNKICAGVARNPQRYLVPHPTDCTKFYSCQRNGWGGWIANLMDCPVTTGFDRSVLLGSHNHLIYQHKSQIICDS